MCKLSYVTIIWWKKQKYTIEKTIFSELEIFNIGCSVRDRKATKMAQPLIDTLSTFNQWYNIPFVPIF